MTKEEKAERIKKFKRNAKRHLMKDMRTLGHYRKEYDGVIDLTADMIAQYNLAWEMFVENGCKAECVTTAGGVRKTAEVTTMEELRRQIGQYMDRLKLTPKSQAETEHKQVSALETVFAEIKQLQDGS